MKFDNIESYEYNILKQMVDEYNKKLKKSKGVDPDFPGLTIKLK